MDFVSEVKTLGAVEGPMANLPLKRTELPNKSQKMMMFNNMNK